MREIKFRAWAGGVMVYFDLFNITHTDGLDDNKHFRRTERPQLSISSICPIMQYTGLKDKNGKEIFEGDILDVDSHKRLCKVEWFSPQACFDTRPIKIIDEVTPFRWLQNSEWAYRTEVIGDIYSNPELLR